MHIWRRLKVKFTWYDAIAIRMRIAGKNWTGYPGYKPINMKTGSLLLQLFNIFQFDQTGWRETQHDVLTREILIYRNMFRYRTQYHIYVFNVKQAFIIVIIILVMDVWMCSVCSVVCACVCVCNQNRRLRSNDRFNAFIICI